MSEPKYIERLVRVPVADADGQAIAEGSVIERREPNPARGVVTAIVRPGQRHPVSLGQPWDMMVEIEPGQWVVSNEYGLWRHIPHNRQTLSERLRSWLHRPFEHDPDGTEDRGEQLAVDAIMTLLPDDHVDPDYGQIPNDLEHALWFLVGYLENREQWPLEPGCTVICADGRHCIDGVVADEALSGRCSWDKEWPYDSRHSDADTARVLGVIWPDGRRQLVDND